MFNLRAKTYQIAGKKLRIQIPGPSYKENELSPDALPLFDIVWPSSKILCHYLRDLACEGSLAGKRILELGCGLGLPSLYLKSLGADIAALDIHPITSKYMLKNTKLNMLDDITFHCMSWSEPAHDLGEYDLILGSDVLYEPEHIEPLAVFIKGLSHSSSEVVIVDPERGQLSQFREAMLRNGFTNNSVRPDYQDTEIENYLGVLDHFRRNS